MGGAIELLEGLISLGFKFLETNEETILEGLGISLEGGTLVHEVTLQEETPLDLHIKGVLQFLLFTDDDVEG